MRKSIFIKIIAVCIGIFMQLTACAATQLISELPQGEGTNIVFVSKSMINKGSSMAGQVMGPYARLIKDIDSIEVYVCENESMFKEVRKGIDKLIKKIKADVLVKTQDESDINTIYLLQGKTKEADPAGMIVSVEEPDEIVFVIINGKIDMKALGGMTNPAGSK